MNEVSTMTNDEIRESFKDLDDELLDFECNEMKANSTGFVVDTPEKADWAIGKIRQANEKKEYFQRYYEAKFAWLKALVEKKIEAQNNTIAFMEHLLEPYVEEQIVVNNSKTKSIKLSNGVAGFRTVKAKFDVDDNKLLAWVKKSAPDKVKITESVDWAALKKEIATTPEGKVITKDGEVVDGVNLVNDEHNVFYVK